MKKIVSKQKEEDFKVDVTNDAEMVALGLRQPNLAPRDPSVWTKTAKEKELLKKYRRTIKGEFSTGWGFTKRSIPVYSKLIVTIKPSPKFTIYDKNVKRQVPKTTFSFKCGQSDISRILSHFVETDKRLDISCSPVIKYSWNGKTYSPKELPFWFGD